MHTLTDVERLVLEAFRTHHDEYGPLNYRGLAGAGLPDLPTVGEATKSLHGAGMLDSTPKAFKDDGEFTINDAGRSALKEG